MGNISRDSQSTIIRDGVDGHWNFVLSLVITMCTRVNPCVAGFISVNIVLLCKVIGYVKHLLFKYNILYQRSMLVFY